LESDLAIDYALVSVVELLGLTMLSMHALACMWLIIPLFETPNDSYPEFWLDTDARLTDGVSGFGYQKHSSLAQYISALYFVTITATSTGYGDITPATILERGFCIFTLILGQFLFGYLIGSISNILSSKQVRANRFASIMSDMNDFMSEHSLSPSLKQQMRSYLRYRFVQSGGEGKVFT